MAASVPEPFGPRLKALRETAGYTQEELATIAGLSVHAIYLLMAVATIVLSLAMKRGAYATWIAYFGFATAALDIIGSYPWAIGPVPTLVCELSFAGWFVAVGSQLFRMRSAA